MGGSDSQFQRPISGSITGVSQNIDLSSPNSGTEIIQVKGTWVGTLIVEGSNDNSIHYPIRSLRNSTNLIVTEIIANDSYMSETNAWQFLRIRSSAWTSGTADIIVYGSDMPSLINTDTHLRGASDGTPIGNVGDRLKVDAAVSVEVTASGVPDKSTFIYGTDSEQPVGGVYQDTSPGLTAGQTGAVRLTENRAFHSNLRKSNGAEVASSVNDGVNNELLLGTKTPDTITATTALGALNAAVEIPVEGLTGVGFQILAGSLIGTITPEISIDNGINWFPVAFYDAVAASTLASIIFSVANTTKLYTVLCLGGTTRARARVSAYTSGTADALMSASLGSSISLTPSGAGGGAQAFGTVTNTTPAIPNNVATLIISANPSRKYLMISNPSGSLCYIGLGNATGLTTSRGIPIPARTFFELKGDNLFTGPVYAISSSAITFYLGEGTP